MGIVDLDRVCAGYLYVHVVVEVDPHYVGSRHFSASCGGGGSAWAAKPLQADPFDESAWKTQQAYVTHASLCGAAAHDQHRFAGGRCDRCARSA